MYVVNTSESMDGFQIGASRKIVTPRKYIHDSKKFLSLYFLSCFERLDANVVVGVVAVAIDALFCLSNIEM